MFHTSMVKIIYGMLVKLTKLVDSAVKEFIFMKMAQVFLFHKASGLRACWMDLDRFLNF